MTAVTPARKAETGLPAVKPRFWRRPVTRSTVVLAAVLTMPVNLVASWGIAATLLDDGVPPSSLVCTGRQEIRVYRIPAGPQPSNGRWWWERHPSSAAPELFSLPTGRSC